MSWSLEPSLAGAAFAALAVAGGAPIFSEGLRVHRLRRDLAVLRERALADQPTGLVHVRGRVALESPLFAPLSGQPCAGFVLDVGSAEKGRLTSVVERRPFRLVGPGAVARVAGEHGRWTLKPGLVRKIAPDEPLTQRLGELIARSPEAAWLRRSGETLALVERVLPVGSECHVVGTARQSPALEEQAEDAWLRTGTDDVPVGHVAIAMDLLGAAPSTARPDFWIDDGGSLEFLHVSDRAPEQLIRNAPSWKRVGLALGPLLSLAGLLYLANAADRVRALHLL
jgi:hypothetical protein